MNRTTNRDSWMDMTNGLTVTREKGRGGRRENKMLKKLKINKLKKKKRILAPGSGPPAKIKILYIEYENNFSSLVLTFVHCWNQPRDGLSRPKK